MSNAIVGYGFVGKATEYLFRDSEFVIHDPAQDMVIADWSDVELAFLCVPTPLKDGSLDLTILSEVYNALPEHVIPVIRSTIGPDQVELFPRAIFMPEFLRENNWKEDVDDVNIPIILGASQVPNEHRLKLLKLISSTMKFLQVVSGKEAMMFKMARNTALAMTVALANELYQICLAEEMSYPTLMGMLTDDEVLASSHWQVPGPDGDLGFGGKCLPKDMTHMSNLSDAEFNIMKTALLANAQRRPI